MRVFFRDQPTSCAPKLFISNQLDNISKLKLFQIVFNSSIVDYYESILRILFYESIQYDPAASERTILYVIRCFEKQCLLRNPALRPSYCLTGSQIFDVEFAFGGGKHVEFSESRASEFEVSVCDSGEADPGLRNIRIREPGEDIDE